MSLEKKLRALLAVAMAVLAVVGAAALLYLTDSLLSVWDRLNAAPALLRYLYWGSLLLALLLFAWLMWRLLRPTASKKTAPPVMTEAALRERIEEASGKGIDVSFATHELEQLAVRRAAGRLALGLVGNVSAGKSSLVSALVPGADPVASVRGGSTRSVSRYSWQAPSGDVLELIDLPGLNEADGTLDQVTVDEAMRSHIVIFVCEGDLSRDEFAALKQLLSLEKPLVVAVNKKDRMSRDELAQTVGRLEDRLAKAGSDDVPVVAISAGGVEAVVRDVQGMQSAVQRRREPAIDDLVAALERRLDESDEALQQLRDRSVFFLVESRLHKARSEHRKRAAADIVSKYTRRAVIGSLAAISPGSDLLIQGYLGTGMVRELCELFEIPAKQIDIDRFLNLSQSHIGRALPLTLAVAGNGLKAFPGAGTVAGGLVHAVAYGMIFDALGNSLSQTMLQRGALLPGIAAARFKESLGENLESRSSTLAKLALESAKTRLDDGDKT